MSPSASTDAVDAPVYLVKGNDPVLVNEAVLDLVTRLVGSGDRALMVEELDADRYQADGAVADVAPLVDAAQTPPFLTERRVVVGRHAGTFGSKDALAPLLAYLSDPLPTTSLVLVWEREPRPGARLASVPKALVDGVRSASGVIVETAVSDRARDRAAWFDDQVRATGLKLATPARDALVDHLSGDPGRLPGVLTALVSVYGEGASLSVDDIAPYLGEASDVKPWELTDAIDRGDVPLALERLQRMIVGGAHPLQVMAMLHTHYARMLRLEGADETSEARAAELLGLRGRSTYPAKKALEAVRRLGPDRLHESLQLLAEADLDLRGATAVPDDAVMQVLVARLASRNRSGRARSRR
jgi:DNA polymerase III subunit delta